MASKVELTDDGVMIFRPTMKEFKDFQSYVAYMESCGAHQYGIAKVIPPKEWNPKADLASVDDMIIKTPVSQLVTGKGGLYQQFNVDHKPLTVKKHRELAYSDKYRPPKADTKEELERRYWKNISFNPPIYGADVAGSITHPSIKTWNINCLPSVLDELERSGVSIPGVNTAYLYFGMWKTTFAWHTEDMDLYSINYLHHGAPKAWYAIPPAHGKRLEGIAKGFFPISQKECSAFLRHKMTIISPSILKSYSIPFRRALQQEGEFIITFPFGYHAGFNCGYNIAESTNFALERWIDFGMKATRCFCRPDTVKIDMELFKTLKLQHGTTASSWNQYAGRMRSGATRVAGGKEKETGKAPSRKKQSVGSGKKTSCAGGSDASVCGPPARKSKYGAEDSDTESDHPPPVRKRVKREPTKPAAAAAATARAKQPKKAASSRRSSSSTPSSPVALDCEASASASAPITPPLVHDVATTTEVEAGIVGATVDDVMGLWQHQLHVFSVEREWNKHVSQAGTQCAVCTHIHVPDEGPTVPEHMLKYLKQQSHPVFTPEFPPVSTVGEVSPSSCVGPSHCASSAHVPSPPIPALPVSSESVLCDSHDEDDEFHSALEEDDLFSDSSITSICSDHNYMKMDGDPAVQHRHRSSSTSSGLGGKEGNCHIAMLDKETMETISLSPSQQVAGPSAEEADSDVKALVTCRSCMVTVHCSCYGMPELPASASDWLCSRCVETAESAECCLCAMRGGALKKTDDGRWAHVLCAICVPEVKFGDLASRQPICVGDVPTGRFRAKCAYCQQFGRQRVTGACLPCGNSRCKQMLHVTCACRPKCHIYQGDWPAMLQVLCHKHDFVSKTGQRGSVDFSVGEPVFAKHKNCRYYKALVEEIMTKTMYEVLFDDFSYSNNMYPEDIVNRDCALLGPPPVGDHVQVKWTDGKVYGGIFTRSRNTEQYLVTFEDQSTRALEKEFVFGRLEELPKKVKAKLTISDDEDVEEVQEHMPEAYASSTTPTTAPGRRQRRPCSRFTS